MSKTLGNVIDPFTLINKYGTDAVRYYLLREIPPFNDGDYSESRMKELYSSDLANELGNIVMRITTLAEKDGLIILTENRSIYNKQQEELFGTFQFNIILEQIWEDIKSINKQINDFEPWNKTSGERKEFLIQVLQKLHLIGQQLFPFIPSTAEKIMHSTQGTISKIAPLFPRLK